MAAVSNIAIGVLALSLAGCEMRVARAKTPPVPAPAAVKKDPPPSPAPSEPLSIPQTQVQLPRPQPIDQEALAPPPTNVPADPASQHPAHKNARRQLPQPVAAKPEVAENADPPAVETRPRIEPVLPAEQRQKMLDDIANRLRDVEQKFAKLSALKLSDPEKGSLARIRSFADLAHQAHERGDAQQAAALVERAALLAEELAREK